MGRWIGPVFLFALLSMMAPVAAADAPAAPFTGLLSMDEAIQVEPGARWRDVGTSLVTVDRSADTSALRPHATVDDAILHIAETTWQTDTSNQPTSDDDVDASWTIESYQIQDATMHTASSEAARWVGMTPYLPTGLPTAKLGGCAATPGHLDASGLPATLTPPHPELGGWAFLPPTVVDRLTPPTTTTPLQMACSDGGFGTIPFALLLLDEATLVFEQEQRGGLHVNLVLNAGYEKRANASTPWLVDHTLRLGVLDMRGHQPALVEFVGDPDVRTTLRMWTPATTVEASLHIPASQGTARWGTIHANGTLNALRSTGTLTLSSPSDHEIAFNGIAWKVDGLGAVPATPIEDAAAAAVLAVAAGLAATALVTLVRRLAPAGVALYSRLDEKQAAEHPRRQLIMDCVRNDPGVTVQDVVTRTGLSRRAVDYHIGVLVREGLLLHRKIARKKALFPKDVANPDEQVRLHLAKRSQYRRLLRLLADEPDLSQRQIGNRLGVSQPHVSRLLQRLRALGVVRMEGQNAERRYQVTIEPEVDAC